EKMYQHNKQVGATTDRIGLYKANILFYEKDFSGAETAVVKILKSAIKGSDTRLIYDCYITLGLSLEGLNQNDQALVYYNKAFELIEKMRTDPQYASLKAQTYNYIGKIYQKINDHSKAINYFNEALRFETKKTLLYANLMNNIGYSNFILENNNSLYYLNEAFQIRDSLQNIPGLVSSNINLSRYYLAQKDSATALQYCLSAKKKAHENKIFEDELIALKLLSKITPNKSLEYTKQYINLNDSLQNIERATRNKFARIEFETDEILNEKNTIEAEKEQISSQRWLILFSSLIAIVILVLIYITRMQHAKNKELQLERKQQEANEEIYRLMLAQQSVINEARQGEKKRISQELHDGVMSKLTSTRLNLFILSKKQDPETIQKCLKHIDGIQDIEKEIRNISHDLNKDALLEKDSFQAIVGNLFEEYKNTTGLAYQIEMDEKINWKKIDNTIKIHLYRIFQEALQNIYKYASATEVILDVVKADDSILIEINDNGQGFDVAKMREGIGLKNMQSRIKTINGNFTIESVIGKGTSIKITIPA
ncbi:MAG: sensor histidine kinase, partial [Flavobacterium sp.]|nr:sensor histidine kinase [Flavobacterium sp.]